MFVGPLLVPLCHEGIYQGSKPDIMEKWLYETNPERACFNLGCCKDFPVKWVADKQRGVWGTWGQGVGKACSVLPYQLPQAHRLP